MPRPKEILRSVRKDPFLKADHIYVWTTERVVTLEGVVPNASIREIAEFDAWYAFDRHRVDIDAGPFVAAQLSVRF